MGNIVSFTLIHVTFKFRVLRVRLKKKKFLKIVYMGVWVVCRIV